jgi:hypothetical protein
MFRAFARLGREGAKLKGVRLPNYMVELNTYILMPRSTLAPFVLPDRN